MLIPVRDSLETIIGTRCGIVCRINYPNAEQWVSIGISIIALRGGELMSLGLIKPSLAD
jgi:hypothetical protein